MLWLLPWQGRVNYGWPPLSCRDDGGSAAFCCSTLEPLMFYYCWRMRCSATLSNPNELSDTRSYQQLQQRFAGWQTFTHRALTERILWGARSSLRTWQKGTWTLLERYDSIMAFEVFLIYKVIFWKSLNCRGWVLIRLANYFSNIQNFSDIVFVCVWLKIKNRFRNMEAYGRLT